MSKRPIRGESPSAAHERQAAAPQDEEGPLASASASLAQQASPFSIPKMPLDLIADLILPFVADRATWNSVHSASKDLWLAGTKMTPPWPNKSFNLENSARHVAFSPSGSQLAFCVFNSRTGQQNIHVWDRWGKEAPLGDLTEYLHCLEYSLDGEHLASGSGNGSIRIWHTESLHAIASQPHMERPTRTPKQADVILVGSYPIMALSFSRTDSNLLASGGSQGRIKVWNVKEQACIHSFDQGGNAIIRSLLFAGGADIACMAVTGTGSIIRFWRAEGSLDFSSETVGEACPGGFSPGDEVFSPSGSFVAANFTLRTGNGFTSTLALYEVETMTKTQSVVMSDFSANCLAVSPDSKQLAVVDSTGGVRLLQAEDLRIQRDLHARGEGSNMPVSSVAFDPTCRFLAVCLRPGRLELRTLC